jgi:hypothetical protein
VQRKQAEPAVADQRDGGVVSLRRVDEHVRGGEPLRQVVVIARQVASDRDHLDARHPVPHQQI